MTVDEARLSALRSAKLGHLVAQISGADPAEVNTGSTGTALAGCVLEGRSYVLADQVRDLGSALHWHRRQDHSRSSGSAAGLTILAESNIAGELARRADLLEADVVVYAVDDDQTSLAKPTPRPTVPELSDELWRAAGVMADAGARVVDDHGRLTAEVNGLEVARIDQVEGPEPIVLQVGVGEADRELHGYVHGHLDDQEKLANAIATVAEIRRHGVGLHPLSRLARPRWLRSMVVNDPSLVGLTELQPQPPLRPSQGVFDTEPAAAYAAAERAVVVCSSGVDVDLIPEAADLRDRIDPEALLIFVLPERDAKLATAGVDQLLSRAEVRAIDPPWESIVS